MSIPDVSVVIPTYNEGAWLGRTVRSILRAKTDLDVEIVVADDGCDDGSIEEIRGLVGVRVVGTGGTLRGCGLARNCGARAARGRCLCFLDSHVLVHDGWLDCLEATRLGWPRPCLVSGNLLSYAGRRPDDRDRGFRFAYTVGAWTLRTTWYLHAGPPNDAPYPTPLAPGGLMYLSRRWFDALGGWERCFGTWGGEDVEFSLRNWYFGGDNVADPRVVAYHYYKDLKDHRPSFTVDWRVPFRNALFVADTYFPEPARRRVHDRLASEGDIRPLVEELSTEALRRRIAEIRTGFVRGYDAWVDRFRPELAALFAESSGPDT